MEEDDQNLEDQPLESGQVDGSSPDSSPPPQESVDEPVVGDEGQSQPPEPQQPADPTPEAEQPAPNLVDDLEKEIDALDTYDPDAVKASMKKMVKMTAEAHRQAAEAQQRADALDRQSQRGQQFKAAAQAFGVSRTEAETIFDQQVDILRKRGITGDALATAATARWEAILEMKKDQGARRASTAPPTTVKPATPVTRGGATTIPAGRAPTPVAVAKPKSFDERVREGAYGNLEDL